MSMLDAKFIAFVEKHKATFMLIILLLGNVYQYIHSVKTEQRFFEENKRLNERDIEKTFKTLEYERFRSEKLEFLLNNLEKSKSNDTTK